MRTFECDYTEGVHPKILSALTETNMEQMSGYGFDPYTARAAEKIKAACNAPDATVTFLVGGTKLGLLCGEAVVFSREAPKMLLSQIKRHGGLLAKGRVLGVQFDAFFTDGLYESIGKEAIRHAKRIRSILLEKGYPLAWESPTNQQFILLSDAEAERLRTYVGFDFWGRWDEGNWIARFTSSWSTTDADVEELRNTLPERAALLQ